MGNFFAKDPFLNRQRSNESLPWRVLSSYMEDIYSFARTEYEEWLKATHPDLVDSETGKYIGATTKNAMEVGNWRMKYELRSSYQNVGSIESRCILMVLKDSLQTFKEGKPHKNFANINGRFDFQRTMEDKKTTIAGEPVEKYIYR